MQNQDMNLVLSTDAKPRLKWTPELHQRFVDAIIQLGGTQKATPKSLMRVMGVSGLTLYHLKSHLQKYRLGKNHLTEACSTDSNHQEDCKDDEGKPDPCSERTSDESNEFHVARAIQAQVVVQRKLHEQIEVQKHLQLRIEAQGKYLQEVLKKAQETLAGYTSSPMGIESARAELSHLVSMVSSGCPSPSLSELTESRDLSLENVDDRIRIKRHGSSTESSLTSIKELSVELPFLKRKGSTISEASNSRKQATQREDIGTLDLNRQYQDDQNLGKSTIDLNSIGIEQFHDAS